MYMMYCRQQLRQLFITPDDDSECISVQPLNEFQSNISQDDHKKQHLVPF